MTNARAQEQALVPASTKEIDEPVVVRSFDVAPQAKPGMDSLRNGLGGESLSEPPKIPNQNAQNEALRSITGGKVAIPDLCIPVFEGVIPPVLERRVNPV